MIEKPELGQFVAVVANQLAGGSGKALRPAGRVTRDALREAA
jgi:hypothetical protein